MKAKWIIGAGATALAAHSATAQVTTSPPMPSTNTEQSELADIVVTATKVETTVQKTPVAISTLTGGDLLRSGVTTAQDLNKLVPGLQIEQTGPGASIFIRGVGSRVLTALGDPAVAFSVDGVYYSRPTGPGSTFFDIARLEVVKGPQGTLYGRNATGGGLNVVTNRPVLGVRSLDVSFEAGNYQFIRGSGAINIPIAEDFAIRLAGQSVYHNGYFNDGYNDQNTKAVRLSGLYNPRKGFSVFLSGNYSHDGGQGPATVAVGPDARTGLGRFVVPNDPYVGISDPRANAFLHTAAPATALPIPGGVFCVGLPFPPGSPYRAGGPALTTCSYPLGVADAKNEGYVDDDNYGLNLTTEADLGIGNLTAIGGYLATRVNTRFYLGPVPQQTRAKADQYTGEVRLASKPSDSGFKWIVGSYYSRETQSSFGSFLSNNSAIPNPSPTPGSPLPQTICVSPFVVPGLCIAKAAVIQKSFQLDLPDIRDENYAFFGQSTLSLVRWLRVTGGVRYTHEKKDVLNGRITQFYTAPAGVSTSYPTQGSVSFNDTSYKAGVEIDLAPRSLLYASYSTAFHAGGINQGVAAGPNRFPYDPEKVKSYVVGVKNRFFGNRLQLNVEGFWLDYANYQVTALGRINDGSMACSTLLIAAACPISLVTTNAARARSRGIETDVDLKIGHNGEFTANILYNEARFRSFIVSNLITGAITNYSGRHLPGTPDVTITAGYAQRFPLADGSSVIADVRSQFRNDTPVYFNEVPGNFQKAYTRTDLSLTYQLAENRLSVTAYVHNVENKATLLQAYNPSIETGVPYNSLNPPRTFGAIIGYHF